MRGAWLPLAGGKGGWLSGGVIAGVLADALNVAPDGG